MNSEEKQKMLLAGLIPGGIIAAIAVLTSVFDRYAVPVQMMIVLATYAAAVLLIYLFFAVYNGWFRARFDLWKIGKIRGLWQEKGLIKQIQRCFASSQHIMIKVTRGYDLLSQSNEYGFSSILNDLKDGKGKNHKDKVEIQFLLILPCFQEEHVRDRYERHIEMTEEQYLETWYKFLKQIRTYNTDNLSINVRFYFGSHARWRFYIFSKKPGANTDVLLSSYEKKTPGSGEPMYKIIKGEQNIGAFMTNYFNEMWAMALTPQKLYKYINEGKCKNGFCAHCKNVKESSCIACTRQNCVYENLCRKLVKNYKRDLESFNAR